jgi:hypothetical protein
VQFDDPDYFGGANEISLNEARKNFSIFGAISKKFKGEVRDPFPEEMPTEQKNLS